MNEHGVMSRVVLQDVYNNRAETAQLCVLWASVGYAKN